MCSLPNKMVGFVVGPALISSKVVAGKRGELRRIEDKMDSKNLRAQRVFIRMEAGHGNRRLPLVWSAWIAMSDSSTRSVFSSSRMLVSEYPGTSK